MNPQITPYVSFLEHVLTPSRLKHSLGVMQVMFVSLKKLAAQFIRIAQDFIKRPRAGLRCFQGCALKVVFVSRGARHKHHNSPLAPAIPNESSKKIVLFGSICI